MVTLHFSRTPIGALSRSGTVARRLGRAQVDRDGVREHEFEGARPPTVPARSPS